ncbi:MAG: aminodeoxychorismate synthase component I [Pseudomonadota bacterium]
MEVVELDYYPDTAARLGRVSSYPGFVFLDSCASSGGGGRYDVVAWEPRTRLTSVGGNTTIESHHGRLESNEDPFALLAEQMDVNIPSLAELPFCGGALGFFGYDLARVIESLPSIANNDLSLPDLSVGIYDWCLVVDHLTATAKLVHHGLDALTVERFERALQITRTVTPPTISPGFSVISPTIHDTSYERYSADFRKIKRYIRDGDCYQVNYAQRFCADIVGDPWMAYLRLRELNPAPYAAFIRTGDGAILSSSPERFISVRGRKVETKPIKGTRARVGDRAGDESRRRELLASEKDQAENLMIVDLLRNDLAKVCEPGSVDVPDLFTVESFARVHHLVSRVTGTLSANQTALDLLRACFPGGSITGAPKVRAMEIIDELEPTRRKIYCGSIGYLSFDGQIDTNIAIRTMLCTASKVYCWAGGGIVMDSDLDAEYQESLDKAAAMLNVLSDAQAQFVSR